MVGVAEPAAEHLLVGVAGEVLEVLVLGDRPAELGEQLLVDARENGLVVRERAVEVEDDRPHRRERSVGACRRRRSRSRSPPPAFHALWNLLLAVRRDVEAATAVALVTAELVFLPVAVVVWRVDSGVWPWVVGSGLLELAYFALLAAAYRRAPLSVVYPIARGGAPVLVLVDLGRRARARHQRAQAAGVALVVARRSCSSVASVTRTAAASRSASRSPPASPVTR